MAGGGKLCCVNLRARKGGREREREGENEEETSRERWDRGL